MTAAFTVAPASERTLDMADYLLGCLELAFIVGGFAFAAWQLRRTVLPGWSGAPARVVEAVVAIALLTLVAEALGTFAAFEAWTMILGGLLAAAAATWAGGRWEGRAPGAAPPAPPASRIAVWLAAAAVAVVAAAWMVPTLGSLAGGMDRADSIWYHMPLATRFAQGAHFGTIDYFDPIFFASYYPANSEIFHAVPILAFDRDILSPLLNLAWLALGLTAAYAIGRPYGLGPQSLIGGAIALGAENLVEFQAGEALNDIVGVSLILAAVAVLVNAWAARTTTGDEGVTARARSEGAPAPDPAKVPTSTARVPPGTFGAGGGPSTAAIAVAGLAAGLAAGTKLSFLAPVLALFVGLVVIAPKGLRWRTGLWFAIPAFLAGGYWFVRNAIAIGNPIPFTSWGPLGLPAPERAFELRPGFSVFHYATDFDVWWDWFFPGLDDSFGFLWPAVLAAFVVGAVYAIWRGGDPLLRMLGAVVLFTTVAYVFTPLTAAGEEGHPISFVWNVRYLAPAAAVGLAILPCLPIARRTAQARSITLVALSVLFASTAISLVQWQQGHVKGAIAAGVAVLAGFAAIQWLRDRRLSLAWAAGLTAALALGTLAAGWWEQRHYLERRYENLSPELKLADAVRWGRDLRDAKVAVAGVRGVFNQYPFYGTDLSNEVQWLGKEGPDGAYLRIPTCAEWRQALADGGYTHVVTMYDPFNPAGLTDTKEGIWTRKDPAAEAILRDGPVGVYELTGTPDPGACGDLPDLSESELNGDSVNEDRTANQP